jgi:hypothetical protein
VKILTADPNLFFINRVYGGNMHDPKPQKGPSDRPIPDQGLGVLCPEAQADGVPCSELGRECDICPMAAPNRDIPDATAPPAPTDEASGEAMADW